MNKICCQCKDKLPISSFGKNSRNKDGLQYHCKSCWNKIMKVANKKRATEYKIRAKAASKTSHGRFRSYVKSAKIRSLEFTLSEQECIDMFDSTCYYCSASPKVGIDRINNSKGYIQGNVRACCSTCNYMKKDLSESDFIEHILRIASNQ